MRSLGIDFGERRIGLAISDREGRVAVPLETLERSSDRQAARVIRAIAKREGVERLVFGDPRRSDGTRGDASERVERFADRLRELAGIPIELVDESLTSREAEARLRDGAGTGSPSAGRVDALAAQIILQEWLDTRGSRAEPASGAPEGSER